MKHHDPDDETVTHFEARPRKKIGGFFITLYRYRECHPAYGQTECQCTPDMKARNSVCHFCMNRRWGIRLQYKGPMGWKFHSQDKDEDITPHLHPIEDLPRITGDNLMTKVFNGNMYAG